jgi:hypothetical protein
LDIEEVLRRLIMDTRELNARWINCSFCKKEKCDRNAPDCSARKWLETHKDAVKEKGK